MNSRERLENVLSGQPIDRTPVAFWKHFPGDDQRSADFAYATINFQRRFDWDFVKVTPASTSYVLDYGVKDRWQGQNNGDRTPTKFVVQRSLQWTELRTIDPERGEYGKQLEALRMIEQGLQDTQTPLIVTIYSPLSQATRIGSKALLLRHLRTRPDRLRTGLNIITEGILRFMDALKRINIAGLYYVTEFADYDQLSEQEYQVFGTPYDQKILDMIPQRWWLNILQIRGSAPMFDLFGNYRIQALNWDCCEAEPNLADAKLRFGGVLCGGLNHISDMDQSSPTIVRDRARNALELMDNRRLILTAGDTLPISVSTSNLRAAREIVEIMGNRGI